MAKKSAHGGKRKGAGRPPKTEGKTASISVTVPLDVLAAMEALSKAKAWNRSQAVTAAIRGLLKRKGGA